MDGGRTAFFAEQNWQAREAMKSILVDLNTAADNLPDEVREEHPNVPWRNLRDLRNVLSHEYANVCYEAIWTTAVDAPPQRAYAVIARILRSAVSNR
ncbi:DUF86 domain-containing protein [Paenarthrobacter sp. Z7-10]|uniref:HepT-like ribonuclease domain-containing protein n=1 Tax=Paenarthrobacter sp. Z7-10 TaxID=2787635 RepID=UPI003FA78800|nr:DUF86 domain-containing protein [Paenarthrobacter sp. Z7-10]